MVLQLRDHHIDARCAIINDNRPPYESETDEERDGYTIDEKDNENAEQNEK